MQITSLSFSPKVYQKNNTQNPPALNLNNNNSTDTFVKSVSDTSVSFGGGAKSLESLLQEAKNIYVNIVNLENLLKKDQSNSIIKNLLKDEKNRLTNKNNEILPLLRPKMLNAVKKLRQQIVKRYYADVLPICDNYPNVKRRPKTIHAGDKVYKFEVGDEDYNTNVKIFKGETLCAEYDVEPDAYRSFIIKNKNSTNEKVEFFVSGDNLYLQNYKEKNKNISIKTLNDDKTYIVAELNGLEYSIPMKNSKIER